MDYISVTEANITLYTVEPVTKEYCYSKLQAVFEEWEDYKPKEPLIKDKKTRKAIKAWAEVIELNPKDNILYVYGDGSAIETPNNLVIAFGEKMLDPSKIEYGKHYSIEELCGSEE